MEDRPIRPDDRPMHRVICGQVARASPLIYVCISVLYISASYASCSRLMYVQASCENARPHGIPIALVNAIPMSQNQRTPSLCW